MEQNELIHEFSKLYYSRGSWNTEYMGVPIFKCPMDLWIMQEIICNVRPDIIIETGTYCGASALYYAHVLDRIGKSGAIITVDPNIQENRAKHARIMYVQGSSLDPAVYERVKSISIPETENKTLVILDSLHTKDHVLKELELYAPLVSVGSYCVVEDTNVVEPMQAVFEYLKSHDNFVIDINCHKHMITFNPNGFLERIS